MICVKVFQLIFLERENRIVVEALFALHKWVASLASCNSKIATQWCELANLITVYLHSNRFRRRHNRLFLLTSRLLLAFECTGNTNQFWSFIELLRSHHAFLVNTHPIALARAFWVGSLSEQLIQVTVDHCLSFVSLPRSVIADPSPLHYSEMGHYSDSYSFRSSWAQVPTTSNILLLSRSVGSPVLWPGRYSSTWWRLIAPVLSLSLLLGFVDAWGQCFIFM